MSFLAACATMGGSGKGSSAPFQGPDAVAKRRTEISDAAKAAMACMKPKPGETVKPSSGVFAVVADAAGKLKVEPIKWEGPDDIKQCVIDTGDKTTVTPLPGPSVGTLWEFVPPGTTPEPAKAPDDMAVKMQPLQTSMQDQVKGCGDRILGVDFGATIDIAFYLYTNGHAYAPTVMSSDAHDGSFDSCVQNVVATTTFPTLSVPKPFGTTMHFKIGQYGDTQHRKD